MHRGRPDTEHLVDAYKNYSLNPASYYFFNGTCNNLQHKQWGAVLTCYKRMLRAYYEDKRSEPIITYNVYIPLPIGPKTMQHHRINHLNAEYNNNLEDEVYTEFSAAAFRRVPDDVTGIPIVFYNNQYFFDKNYTGFTGEIKRSNGNRGRLKIPVSNV
ncbi:peroxidasin homolog [Varroa jacobsoni]|uniref:peroxidasin homolog n=1 Tax=Varroa jacobsoni TaxID=62625 RepID=UPI000BF8371D|nr:peroxidasin homolog [Varroa jacobsoni]